MWPLFCSLDKINHINYYHKAFSNDGQLFFKFLTRCHVQISYGLRFMV